MVVMCVMESNVFVCGGGVDEGAVGGEEVAGLTVGLGCEEGADAGEFGVELLFCCLLVVQPKEGQETGEVKTGKENCIFERGSVILRIMREKGRKRGQKLTRSSFEFINMHSFKHVSRKST